MPLKEKPTFILRVEDNPEIADPQPPMHYGPYSWDAAQSIHDRLNPRGLLTVTILPLRPDYDLQERIKREG